MILIDYNAIAISNVVTQKLEIDENLIRHMIFNSLRMYRTKHKAKYGELVICTDGKKNWRKEVYPPYKHKRKSARKESKIDWNELFRCTNMVLEELKENFPYKVIENEHCEADDIIAVLCDDTQEFGRHQPVLIVSSDKDFVQLQKYSNVDQYSPMKKGFLKEEHPRKHMIELVLKGDQADGVPNVLSPDNCFVDGIRQTPLRQKAIDALTKDVWALGPEVYRNYQRNYKLINLTMTPDQYKEEIINSYEQQDPWSNRSKVMPHLIEKRCRLLLENAGDFI